MADRPFRDASTEELRVALGLVSSDARHHAQVGPKKQEDALHTVADIFLDELQHRGELA